MYIRNKTASALWKFVLVAFATYGLLDGAGILAGKYLTGADLSAGARNYLKAAGMTDEQVDQLTAYLCA